MWRRSATRHSPSLSNCSATRTGSQRTILTGEPNALLRPRWPQNHRRSPTHTNSTVFRIAHLFTPDLLFGPPSANSFGTARSGRNTRRREDDKESRKSAGGRTERRRPKAWKPPGRQENSDRTPEYSLRSMECFLFFPWRFWRLGGLVNSECRISHLLIPQPRTAAFRRFSPRSPQAESFGSALGFGRVWARGGFLVRRDDAPYLLRSDCPVCQRTASTSAGGVSGRSAVRGNFCGWPIVPARTMPGPDWLMGDGAGTRPARTGRMIWGVVV